MEKTQQDSTTPIDVTPDTTGTGDNTGTGGTTGTGDKLTRATVAVDLKPERVQDDLAATDAGTISLNLQLAFGLSQSVTFGLSGTGLAITFNDVPDSARNPGTAAPAA